jgi:hypothetical protein
VVREVDVPVGAALVVEVLVPGDLGADRELHQQRVQQVHREHVVAAVGGLEDGAQPGADVAEAGHVRLGDTAGHLGALAEEGLHGLHRREGVLVAGRLLGVDQAHGIVRVMGQFHL